MTASSPELAPLELAPLELAKALIRCPSITPADAGALDVLQAALGGIGFVCRRLKFAEVDNLYARIGVNAPHFCFAGHTDVVPAGDEKEWASPPFAAEVVGGRLYGRGAVDMKGAIACFAAAASRFISNRGLDFGGSISFLITSDEEGQAINGAAKVLGWMKENGEIMNACLVGEPSSAKQLGDMIKIGRRGSLNGRITVYGKQGHSAYPELADNPINRLMRMMTVLAFAPLDDGSKHFGPTKGVITSFDVGNEAANVIPSKASAAFNVRFNDLHTGASLTEKLRQRFDKEGAKYDLEMEVSAEPFLTRPGNLSNLMMDAVLEITGREPEIGTTGGTSDARFIKDYCPVIEFGLISETAHKTDESVSVDDLKTLSEIYLAALNSYFKETR